MLIINPYIFKQIPEITFGFSTKVGLQRNQPYYFNMSYTVGDDINVVSENREKYFNQLGLNSESVAYQKQVHGDGVSLIIEGGDCGKSDAMITDNKNLGLAISSADCCAIFIYDPVKELIAGVHSGWRGTKLKILLKVLQILSNEYDSSPGDMIGSVQSIIRVTATPPATFSAVQLEFPITRISASSGVSGTKLTDESVCFRRCLR